MKKITILIILLLIPIKVYSLNYKIKDNKIYITTNDNKEVIVIDDRIHSNVRIINSYMIKDNKTKKEIINTILEYNKKYPKNNWIRTNSSMYVEWKIHNILYKFHLYRNHTKDVDFDLNIEKIYNFIYKYLHVFKNVL